MGDPKITTRNNNCHYPSDSGSIGRSYRSCDHPEERGHATVSLERHFGSRSHPVCRENPNQPFPRAGYYIDRDQMRAAIGERTMFSLMHVAEGIV